MNDLKAIARELLESGKVAVVIGYEAAGERKTRPFFAYKPDDAGRLTFNHHSLNNLAVYLTRKDLRSRGRIGIVAKGCDVRSINMLIREHQFRREDVLVIGIGCDGVVRDMDLEWSPSNIADKCAVCRVQTPPDVDVLIGEAGKVEKATSGTPLWKTVDEKTVDERWSFWSDEFDKCIRCYACRQTCPMCYCEQCVADKTTPRWIESSAHLRGNIAWNIIRAFHLAGRCTGCGECERACPVGIPLGLLNRKMAMVAMNEFNYVAGMDATSPTLVGTYDVNDREEFIR